jgi:hypothetical protein
MSHLTWHTTDGVEIFVGMEVWVVAVDQVYKTTWNKPHQGDIPSNFCYSTKLAALHHQLDRMLAIMDELCENLRIETYQSAEVNADLEEGRRRLRELFGDDIQFEKSWSEESLRVMVTVVTRLGVDEALKLLSTFDRWWQTMSSYSYVMFVLGWSDCVPRVPVN